TIPSAHPSHRARECGSDCPSGRPRLHAFLPRPATPECELSSPCAAPPPALRFQLPPDPIPAPPARAVAAVRVLEALAPHRCFVARLFPSRTSNPISRPASQVPRNSVRWAPVARFPSVIQSLPSSPVTSPIHL